MLFLGSGLCLRAQSTNAPLDPDYYHPKFGDDSTTEELAPTMGKFYLKLQKGTDYGLWGNFNVDYMDNNLAHVDRNLYGANVHFETSSSTSDPESDHFHSAFYWHRWFPLASVSVLELNNGKPYSGTECWLYFQTW